MGQANEVLERIASFAQNDPEFVFALTVLNERTDVHAALGTAYTEQSRFTAAIGAFVDAQSHGIALPDIASPFGSAREAQGQTAGESLGNHRAALAAYRQALKANPQHDDARQGVVRIAQILRPKRKISTCNGRSQPRKKSPGTRHNTRTYSCNQLEWPGHCLCTLKLWLPSTTVWVNIPMRSKYAIPFKNAVPTALVPAN
jgi:tetratricopeptide (TPR) repeat protein